MSIGSVESVQLVNCSSEREGNLIYKGGIPAGEWLFLTGLNRECQYCEYWWVGVEDSVLDRKFPKKFSNEEQLIKGDKREFD